MNKSYIIIFLLVTFIYNTTSLSLTRQDILRIQLSRLNDFEVIGKYECCKKINKWKFENKEDNEYRILLDQGMRQICNDNVFPIVINSSNAEYIIINLIVNSDVNILNILSNKKNTKNIDEGLLKYHTFLIENNYNPNYYQLKSVNNNQFLTALYLNLFDEEENKMIRLKKKNYLEYLEHDTRNKKNRNE
jgi:hypothetical protein